ncbi:TonB-dependent receptor [uncultured Roseovarius sp.]|uniref:TonB-dependent receptor n=1 Tax=uncultured Roseovarius sp. TaxID=293344 RepID=UPI0026346F6B|nr:TonB-dependent receptor [uncultured Roseovarius sp.]
MTSSRYLIYYTVSAVALVQFPALAQESRENYDLGTIVLRGELQSRSLQDSPTSAAVETGEILERRGDTDLYDVIERTPNVVSSFGEKGFSIRGVDQRGVGGGSGLVISTQVDGVALPSNQATFFGPYSAWDLEQVEVLRGPQSTQQGRNALAGAVVIRSKDPTYEQEFKLHAEAGSRDHQRFAAMANIPIIDNKLALRFSAEHLENDGFITNPTLGTDDYDGREMTTYRAKLLWDPAEDVEVIFSYSHTENFGGEDFVNEPPFPANRFNFSNVRAIEGSDHDIFGVRVNWAVNDIFSLESETNYYMHDYVRVEDFDFSPANLGFLNATAESEVFEQDLRLRFETNRVSGVLGLFYTEIDDNRPSEAVFDIGFLTVGVPNGIFATRLNEFPTTTTNYAIFGEADIKVDEILSGLSFTLGARYDKERFKFADITTVTPAVVPGTNFSGRTSYDAFLPKAGVTYDFAENQSVSLTIQRGYRAGGAQVNLFTGVLNEFDPEYTTNYELAYRGEFYDGNLRVAANMFYVLWRDQQVDSPGASGSPFDNDTLNAGKSELFGGELMVEGDATENLSLFGSVGYAHTEFLRFTSAGNNFAGNSFPLAPEWTAALGGEYSWNNGVSFGMDLSYTGASYFDAANSPGNRSDDRWLVNAQLTYENDGGWLTGVYVRNLFDKDYAVQRNASATGTQVRTGEPLSVGAFATKTF